MKALSTVTLTLASLLLVETLSHAAPHNVRYKAIPIDPPPGTAGTSAVAINEKGTVAGCVIETEDWSLLNAYLWSGSEIIRLPRIEAEQGFERRPMGINNHDQVVGLSSFGDPLNRTAMTAFYWEQGMAEVHTLTPLNEADTWVGARMIDDAGRIVGFSGPTINEAEDAVYWSSFDSAPFRMKTLPSAPKMTGALAMNHCDPPQIVGWCGDTYEDQQALFWSAPEAQPCVLPRPVGASVAVALSVNNKEQVAGFAIDAAGHYQAVLWQKGRLDLLVSRGVRDWRDVEALAALDSPRARVLLLKTLKSGKRELAVAVTEHAPNLVSEAERVATLVAALEGTEIYGGLTQTLLQVESFHPPQIVEVLLRGVLTGEGGSAVHFAAMLMFIHGQTTTTFEWDKRPFFLKFNTDDRAERQTLFRELCGKIRVSAEKYLATPPNRTSAKGRARRQ